MITGIGPVIGSACAVGGKFLTVADGEISMSQESVDRTLESRKPQDFVQRFFGGPPLAVLGRLVLLSILVGVILTAIGLDPWNIIESVERLITHLWNMGFDAVRWLWRYFLLGAVIVVPIWLLVRLAKAPRGL
jgi:flagellar biosynthesis protein FlhB